MTVRRLGVVRYGGRPRMKSTVLWMLALAAGTAHAQDSKPAPPADTKPADTKPADPAPRAAAGASAEVKVGTGVENREIAGEAASFPAGTTVWVWSRVSNTEGSVKHVWKRD